VKQLARFEAYYLVSFVLFSLTNYKRQQHFMYKAKKVWSIADHLFSQIKDFGIEGSFTNRWF